MAADPEQHAAKDSQFGAGRGSDTEGAAARNSRPTSSAAKRSELARDEAIRAFCLEGRLLVGDVRLLILDLLSEHDRCLKVLEMFAIDASLLLDTLPAELPHLFQKMSAQAVNERIAEAQEILGD